MSEYVDLVDENDQVIDQTTKEHVHDAGLTNFRLVNIFIVNTDKKFLIQKRPQDRALCPGCYDFSCAEHLQAGETYAEGAVRGLQEELGIDVSEDDLTVLGKGTPADGFAAFQMIYLLAWDGEVEPSPEEIDALYWWSFSQLADTVENNPENCKKDLPIVIDTFKEQLLQSSN